MSDKLKIGVLGCANIAKRSVIPAIKKVDGVELVAVASRSRDKANEFAELFNCEAIEGYQNLIDREDIDAIYMPLPPGLHEEWVIKALSAGKHLLVEKSLAINYKSAIKMVALAKKKALLLMESFMFLYHGQHQYVKELIANNAIGEIRALKSSFGFPPLKEDNYRYDKDLGGGALLDAGVYTLRASQLFLGDNLKVCASSLNINKDGVDIYGGAFLKGENNLFSEVAFGFDNFYQCNYEIWGSKGKIVAHKAFTPGTEQEPLITIERDSGIEEIRFRAEDQFKNLLKEFNRCIKSDDYNPKYNEILTQSRLLKEVRDTNDD
jgi:predicted dehydrogenase